MSRSVFCAPLFAFLFCAGAAAETPHDLHCVSYERNSRSGVRLFTDCSDGVYAPPWNDGISWLYNRSRMDNFFRQKNEEKVYNREFLLRTGLTPAEADRLIAGRDRAGAPSDETEAANPEKVNFNILELAASEMFVYSSTDQQKNLTDSYYESLVSPAHLSAKTTAEQKAELKRRLEKLATDLSALKALKEEALAYESAPWGATAAELKKLYPDLAETGPSLLGLSKDAAGQQAKVSFRLMRDKLVSVTLSFKPLNISRVELEQLRLLLSGRFGWPSDCKYRNGEDLDCSWATASGLRLGISGLAQPDGAKEIEISLVSRKLMDEFLDEKKESSK